MKASEEEALILLALGQVRSITCDSQGELRRIRVWMAEHHPELRVRNRQSEYTGKITVRVEVRH